jgi:hypothetical protein
VETEVLQMKNVVLLCFVLLFLGCNATRDYGPETPYYHFPDGSRLVLGSALEIPANWATVRLQFGKTAAFGHVQEQEPHCILEVSTVLEQPQRIEPDTFAITRVQRSISELAVVPGLFIRTAFADDAKPTQMFYKTILTLKSERQPGVLRLICQSDRYAAGAGIPSHLTVSEIRQALGGIFTLKLP